MSYKNPVYRKSFPDPFVLKWWNGYWGYSTGFQPDGGAFGVLYSHDLVHWQYVGSAMRPIAGEHPCYWAPEVTYENGVFLLYYSVGNEETMHIRVATSSKPEGPFEDAGVQLTKESFAIDPHVFIDDDGEHYMFYATDFLTHAHIGTGTVVDRMSDAYTLERKPQPVTRARYEWQVYDPARQSKGGVKWHTVEGPFALKRKGRYYQMFSGGNWQNLTYGVSYARSDDIRPGHEWDQHADGAKILPILRTLPGKVIGPGHNSVVAGPDNREMFCVYHLWHEGERVLAIDRLDWRGLDLIVLGPTTSDVESPNTPRRIGAEIGSEFTLEANQPRTFEIGASSLLNFWFKRSQDSELQIELHGEAGIVFSKRVTVDSTKDNVWAEARLELDERELRGKIGGESIRETLLSRAPKLTLTACDAPVSLSPIELTGGWEELFESDNLLERGWETDGDWKLEGNELNSHAKDTLLSKHIESIDEYECTINVQLKDGARAVVSFGEKPDELAVALDTPTQTITLLRNGSEIRSIPWPSDIDPSQYQQLIARKQKGAMNISLSGVECFADVRAGEHDRLAITANGSIALDMVRLTELIA